MWKLINVLVLSVALLFSSVGTARAFNLDEKTDVVCTSMTKTVVYLISALEKQNGNDNNAEVYFNLAFGKMYYLDNDRCLTPLPGMKAKVLPNSYEWTMGWYKGKPFHMVQIMLFDPKSGVTEFYYVVHELMKHIDDDGKLPTISPPSEEQNDSKQNKSQGKKNL
jgi:hypothetical protein